MPSFLDHTRFSKTTKYSTAGLVAGAAALSLFVPGSADSGDSSQATGAKASAMPVAFTGEVKHKDVPEDSLAKQAAPVEAQVKAEAAQQKKDAEREAGQEDAVTADAAGEAAKERSEEQSASRSGGHALSTHKAADENYSNNLHGWISEAKDIMEAEGIPGSYEGIHRNIMRESSGDPNVVNDWDINAKNGVPSKGLLQVIKPTFEAYHVEGTSKSLTDPVANIVAACNYAADRYGSMDNVDSAY
ncbi:transglycosylase SLT domain-containing protein [Streptomyces oceani]|uniref:Transglycosylase SLT domain-containing protein n=1 Tax=Streptomyces oceani TaxID=1075402 RepID=A0A1E7KCV0_9ACTN|nr:transglycosylase SLT domain-containing protein [Streptomyces oceani]OEV01742.1 hypothetical protein AN216_16610 [Streptomyces oceani]